MSTRRLLGTGPTTSTRSTATPTAPRLLPAERGEATARTADSDEHQDVAVREGRRSLGPGVTATPKGPAAK